MNKYNITFLIILAMTLLFHHVAIKHQRKLGNCAPKNIDFDEILDADDTLLVFGNTSGMNTQLHAIEDE